MRRREPPGPPPTIGHLRSHGLVQLIVTCTFCRHHSEIAFDATGLPDDTPFPSIKERQRFVCTECGSKHVSIMPNWKHMRAAGMPPTLFD